MKTPWRVARHGVAATAVSLLLLINDVCAAVFRVVGFSVAHGARTFLTEADRFDLAGVHAQQAHHARYGFRTTLAQGQVVLGTTPGVGVAFDAHPLLRVVAQVAGVHLNQAAVLFRHRVAVELEVHRALLRQGALRVEGVHDLTRTGAVRSWTPSTLRAPWRNSARCTSSS